MSEARLDLLVRDTWARLAATAYLLTGAGPAAAELVESALRRRIGDWRGTGPPAGAEAVLRDAVAREAFRNRRLHAAGAAPFAEQGGTAEPMRAVLRRLPLDERTVLVLRLREGLSLEQVVDVLRVPGDVVRERETRAVRALREAALVRADVDPRPDELRPLLDAVADGLPRSSAPDVATLLAGSRRWWRRG